MSLLVIVSTALFWKPRRAPPVGFNSATFRVRSLVDTPSARIGMLKVLANSPSAKDTDPCVDR